MSLWVKTTGLFSLSAIDTKHKKYVSAVWKNKSEKKNCEIEALSSLWQICVDIKTITDWEFDLLVNFSLLVPATRVWFDFNRHIINTERHVEWRAIKIISSEINLKSSSVVVVVESSRQCFFIMPTVECWAVLKSQGDHEKLISTSGPLQGANFSSLKSPSRLFYLVLPSPAFKLLKNGQNRATMSSVDLGRWDEGRSDEINEIIFHIKIH